MEMCSHGCQSMDRVHIESSVQEGRCHPIDASIAAYSFTKCEVVSPYGIMIATTACANMEALNEDEGHASKDIVMQTDVSIHNAIFLSVI
ncbi:hypothetical protein SUGI_0274010 [Cryptomeria japonica]|nr:hypothetical protein SUGI_0274010 [Cryptomeria japonica]